MGKKKRWRLRISPQHYVSPYTDQKVQYTVCHNFFPMRCPCANGIVNARFEDVRTFLHALFYKRCRVFVCQELSVNVPVGISDYGGSSFSSNSLIAVISGLTCKRGERVSSVLYWPFSLVCVPLQTKEYLTAGSTPITAIYIGLSCFPCFISLLLVNF